MAKENEQVLKTATPHQVNSLVQTPRSDDPASENIVRECLQIFETLKKASSLQEFEKMRHSGYESLYKEIELQHSESIHTLVLFQIPEFMPQSQDAL